MKLTPKLPVIPPAPKGVKYALSVPQSVLFTELSLQGNKREYFRKAMGIDYSPCYAIIDRGEAISWNYDSDESFDKAFINSGTIEQMVTKFILDMARTTRKLERRAIFGNSAYRRDGNPDDMLEDLQDYWKAYKLHMTSLFSFWNVQNALSNAIIAKLKKIGKSSEVSEIENHIKPSETNQFLRERMVFEKIVERFGQTEKLTTQTASPELIKALKHHAREFSFLLTPFNLGKNPTQESLLERASEVKQNMGKRQQSPTNRLKYDLGNNIPFSITRLVSLASDLIFWKSERLDVLSMADSEIEDLYQTVADFLNLDIETLFAMTSLEIEQSLERRGLVIGKSELEERQESFCLVLNKGKIYFCQPSDPKKSKQIIAISNQIIGVCASRGSVKGVVKIIINFKDLRKLEPGDVLVTTMTRPEMGVALDRAVAFVTDEGGLLCHAAIIAREMNKPCIVGTREATKILKDGDLIEVDGDKGIVRIL